MRREHTITVGNGETATFDAGTLGFSPSVWNATIAVESGVGTYTVQFRINGVWYGADELTDVADTDVAVVRQVGYDAIRATAATGGDITAVFWKTV